MRSLHCTLRDPLYTFVSARGGWVWLAGGGARKLRHSLTTMVRYLKIRSLITPQIRVLHSKACFMPAKQIISLSVTSSHWTEVAAPPPPSHPGWNTILGQCGYIFDMPLPMSVQLLTILLEGTRRDVFSFPSHSPLYMTPYHATCTGTCSLVVGLYPWCTIVSRASCIFLYFKWNMAVSQD